MTTENNINVNLYNGNNTSVPFVMVDYLDKDANGHCALMMIDSCSEVNILFENLTNHLCLKKIEIAGIHVINGLGSEPQEVTDVELNFTLQSMVCKETFSVCDIDYPQLYEYPVIGLLGNDFLFKHKLALDYSDCTLHTSNINISNLSLADCEYFSQIDLTNKNYRLPVVSLKLNGKQIVAGVDSGATSNLIAKQSIDKSKVPFFSLGDGDTMVGSNGQVATQMGIIPFSTVSASEKGEKVIEAVAIFNIIQDYIIPSQNMVGENKGQQVPPVEALLCSSFIASQGWILDFGACIIYKRKIKSCEKAKIKSA